MYGHRPHSKWVGDIETFPMDSAGQYALSPSISPFAEILEMRNPVVSARCFEEILGNLSPNLREFRFDCNAKVTDAITAFEALKYLKNVKVLELELLFRLCLGEDEADFTICFTNSGNSSYNSRRSAAQRLCENLEFRRRTLSPAARILQL